MAHWWLLLYGHLSSSSTSLEMPRTKCQVKGSTEHLLPTQHTACLHLVGQGYASSTEPRSAALKNRSASHLFIHVAKQSVRCVPRRVLGLL